MLVFRCLCDNFQFNLLLFHFTTQYPEVVHAQAVIVGRFPGLYRMDGRDGSRAQVLLLITRDDGPDAINAQHNSCSRRYTYIRAIEYGNRLLVIQFMYARWSDREGEKSKRRRGTQISFVHAGQLWLNSGLGCAYTYHLYTRREPGVTKCPVGSTGSTRWGEKSKAKIEKRSKPVQKYRLYGKNEVGEMIKNI